MIMPLPIAQTQIFCGHDAFVALYSKQSELTKDTLQTNFGVLLAVLLNESKQKES